MCSVLIGVAKTDVKLGFGLTGVTSAVIGHKAERPLSQGSNDVRKEKSQVTTDESLVTKTDARAVA